ncbi:MAG: helicase associated domain-containing protein, partial [Clostridia bacterium]|nr:helicase associated domain-containing protein [Clostridia bacterium]
MAAGCKKNAVILDIVDNISNLYNIASVREEMQNAIEFFRYYGEDEKIINDSFSVIDEVYDCRRLFDELDDMLSASWDIMYLEAEKYYKTFGDLLPNSHYITELGYPLGQWVVTQRKLYRSDETERLSEDRIEKLEKIGMEWLSRNERLWKEAYSEAEKFYNSHGHLNVTQKDKRLYSWILRQRKRYRDDELSQDEFGKLSQIGMIWEIESSWEVHYPEATQFFEENGHLDIPASYVTESGVNLGAWYRRMRNDYRDGILSKENQKALESIGMNWMSIRDRIWMRYYELAKEYYERNGDLAVNLRYSQNGMDLGIWISSQRYAKKKGTLSGRQIGMLEEIGMSWQRFSNKWEIGYGYAAQYFEENKSCNAPIGYIHSDGFKLGAWISTQRNKYRNGKLSKNQIKRLEELQIDWTPTENSWMITYNEAKKYFLEYGNLFVPTSYITSAGINLGLWIRNQRTKYRKGLLSEDQIDLLEKCNMCWQVTEKKWFEGYGYALRYFQTHNDINISNDYKTENGYNLGSWLSSNRKAYHSGKLSDERIRKLEDLGFSWDKREAEWEKAYFIAKRYQNEFHDLNELSTTYVFD